jgi:cytochrome c553
MKRFRLLIPVLTLAAAFLATTGVSFATKEMSKKEGKACTTCHVKAGKKDLNDTGKYYHEKKTLEGAPAPKK